MDIAPAEEELREALLAFDQACASLLAAMREGSPDLARRIERAEAALLRAQEALERARQRNREARS